MNTLQKIKNVVNEFGAEDVILFGSRAKQSADKFSDYDILAIFTSQLSGKEKINIASRIRKRLAENFIDVDILVRNKKDVECERLQLGSVIKNAMKEGVAL